MTYRDGNPDHINTDGSIMIEERIIASACRILAEGRGVRRRVLVSFAQFFNIARRMHRTISVKAGPHGEYIKLITPAGYLWIVPSITLEDGSEAYAFEQRTEQS